MKEEYKLPVFYFLLTGAFAGWQSFYNLHLDGIGFSSMQIGAINAVFIIGSRIIKRMGAERMILLSMAVSMFRMLLYGLVTVPEVAIVLSIFHCITIAFFLLGVVEYVQARTPNHLRTTGQALIWAPQGRHSSGHFILELV